MADLVSKNPAPGATALLIVDLINDLRFPGGREMCAQATAAAARIDRLRDAATEHGVPVVYVNDNYGLWHVGAPGIVEFCMRPESHGQEFVQRLAPRDEDYFVVKPQFSGFYATNLPVLLPRLGVSRLILTGIATDICVLFTAADAHMRDYDIWVPSDASASSSAQRHAWALDIMAKSMEAETRSTEELAMRDWLAAAD